LLPQPKPRRNKYSGRWPVSDRAALNGILFVFKTGVYRLRLFGQAFAAQAASFISRS
jgi:hypothetical protein